MQVFGTDTELSEYHPVESLNSRQFYLHMQEQYQLELFHTSQAMLMDNGSFMYHPQPVEMQMHPDYMMGHPGCHTVVGTQ